MIASDHYDDEILVAIAEDRAEQDTDPHLSGCEECRTSVEQYRSMISCLGDEAMWSPQPLDETPNPRTIATLRSYVDQMQREDAEAEPLVAALLAGPREEWMPRLMGDEKYRTAGVVRKLIAATDRAIEESPKDYVELAKLAVEISDSLTSPDHGGDEILRLLGASYRERSYSLYLIGDIDGAFDWERRARQIFERVDADFDLARLEMLAATVNWRLDRVPEALTACDRAERLFLAAGDFRRVAHALIVRANVLAQGRRFTDALSVAARVVADFDEFLDDHTRAMVRCNEGFYLRELNEPLRSVECLQEAAFIFDSIGARSSSARVELNAAVLLQMNGDLGGAADRLSRVIRAFEDLGMYSTAALAAVCLAENRATEGRFDEVEPLCVYAMNQARVSPAAYQERALTALALLREASLQRRVSHKLVRRVRRYLERLPHESQPVLQHEAQDF